jgi:hypothetical protein
VLAQLLRGRVEDHHLANSGCLDLSVPQGDGPQVEVADRAPRKPPELQVDQPSVVGRDGDRSTGDRSEAAGTDQGTGP